VDLIAQRDGDASRLALQHPDPIIHCLIAVGERSITAGTTDGQQECFPSSPLDVQSI
jgi:hypothetical protein